MNHTKLKLALVHAAAFLSIVLSAATHQAVLAQSATLPQGGVVTQGQATINTNASGNQMNVVNTPGAVINWNSFNIGSGAGVNFQQQSANSSVMNRVTGGNISTIHGNLTSNGRVILVNPAGLVIGTGAVVDTAGFVGSAMNATEANSQLDRLRFDAAAGSGAAGRIQVDGIIRSASGDIVLVAPDIAVGAAALIQAPGGAVTLAAGQRVQLHGRGLDGITLELQAPTTSAINLGRIEGQAVGMFAGQLRHSGIIDARQASIEGGRIVLRAADQLTVTGTITADGATNAQGQSGKGGSITLEGTRIALQGARISASGPAGGGAVSVGGGWQGKSSSIKNASQTFVDQATQIKANATNSGNGGQVVIWSDGDTWYAGTIEANGGQQAGNGGRVEVSGKQRLGYHGVVNTSAANGQAGSLLLDPKNIYIATVQVGVPSTSTTISFQDGGTNDFVVDPAAIALVSGTVKLQATNDIFVTDIVEIGNLGNTNLILEAGRSVFVNAKIVTNNSGSSISSVTIIANSSASPNVTGDNRDLGTGSIIFAGSGAIDLGSQGTVLLNVRPNYIYGISPSILSADPGGITVTRVSAGTIELNSGTGIYMPATTTYGLFAERVVLRTNEGNIGSSNQPIVIGTANLAVTTTALSVYAPDANSSAYIRGASLAANSIRLAPSNSANVAPNPSFSAQVGGTLQIVNPSAPIIVGATPAEGGSANISATNVVFQSNSGGPQISQIIVAQNTGTPLNISASENITFTVNSSSVPNGIQIGGPTDTSAISINAGGTLQFNASGSALTGITVQGSSAGTIVQGATVTLLAVNDINIISAQVGTPVSTAVVLNSTQGNIAITAPQGQNSLVTGQRVELLAQNLNSSISVQAGTASSFVQGFAGGVRIDAGGNFIVDTLVAGADQRSTVETIGGNIRINAANVSIDGGAQSNTLATISTQGTGSISIATGPGGNFTMNAGSGVGSNTVIDSANNVNITVPNSIIVNGSFANSSFTGIKAANNINLDSGSLAIAAVGQPSNSTYGVSATGIVNANIANNLVLTGANGGLNSTALIRGDGGVNLNATTGFVITGGTGSTTKAEITSNGNITLTTPASLTVTGGTGGGSVAAIDGNGGVSIVAGAMILDAGVGSSVGASIESSGNVNVALTGGLTIDGRNASNSLTGIKTAGDINITAASLVIAAPSTVAAASNSTYGLISTNNAVNITTTSALTVFGVAGSNSSINSQALISGATGVSIASNAILLVGGDGQSNTASITSGGNIRLDSGASGLDIKGGSGTNSNAVVSTTGSVTYTGAGIAFNASQTPGASSHALIYAGSNSVTLALANPSQPIATLAQAGSNSPAVAAILVPGPDVSTSIVLPASLPLGVTGTAVATYTNLSLFTLTFTATVVIDGVPQSRLITLLPQASTSTTVLVTGTSAGVLVSANASTATVPSSPAVPPEVDTANNTLSATINPAPSPSPVLFADVSATINAPISAAAGSLVPVSFTFTNNSVNTVTFTPTFVVNGVVTSLSPVTLTGGTSFSGVQTVTIAGGASNFLVSTGNLSLPELNTTNNSISANTSALLPNIQTSISAPSSGTIGSSTTASVFFYNAGSGSTTITSTVIVNGAATVGTYMINAGETRTLVFSNVLIGTTGASVTANATNSFEFDPANNSNIATIAGVAPIVVVPPVVVPPVVVPPSVTPSPATPGSVQTLITGNLLQQDVVVASIVPSGSTIGTNNSGDTNTRTPGSREDIQADGAPICRP